MFKKVYLLALLLLPPLNTLHAQKVSNFFIGQSQPKHIFINNRILAKVNGKAISVIDLMKKLDLFFYKQFPQYSSSVEARYQFYSMNWKHVLRELVEKQLILADAEEIKMEVSNGDVRQEIENLFGPNIIVNLDKAGLTYEEAWQMVKEDQLIKRTMMARVNGKAVRQVTPQDIRLAYEEYAKTNVRPAFWKYQVVSFKGKDPSLCAEAARFAYQTLTEDGIPLSSLADKLNDHPLTKHDVSYTISDDLQGSEKEVAENYREILASLQPDSFSRPIVQKSKSGDSQVFRIFYLKEYQPGGAPPLAEVEVKLKNKLIDAKIDLEAQQYIARLRRHFDVQDGEKNQLYDPNFQPFILK